MPAQKAQQDVLGDPVIDLRATRSASTNLGFDAAPSPANIATWPRNMSIRSKVEVPRSAAQPHTLEEDAALASVEVSREERMGGS